jgi:hypothetical protein
MNYGCQSRRPFRRLSPRVVRPAFSILLAPILVATAGCATTGATFNSGGGDAMLRQPPWIAGKHAPPDAQWLVLPVAYQAGATQPAVFDLKPAAGTALADLVSEMNTALAARRFGPMAAPIAGAGHTPPDVRFGCASDTPVSDCPPRPTRSGLFSGDALRQRLAVGRPSAEWTRALQARLDSTHATHALVITLEVGQMYPNQRGLRGQKSILLGRNHEQDLPWLTSLDTPVMVLQLTGALVDRTGRVVRIAAEGLRAKRTALLLSAINAQSLWQDQDVAALRTAVREDLPGTPLVWRTALDDLLRDLQVMEPRGEHGT